MLSKVNRSSQLEGVPNNEGGCNVGGDVVREGSAERGGAGDKIDDSLSFSLSCFKYKHTLLHTRTPKDYFRKHGILMAARIYLSMLEYFSTK